MTIYQSNDKTNPVWILEQLRRRPDDISWVGACAARYITMLALYTENKIDTPTLKYNLVNIMGTKHDFATYDENVAKNQLDDYINPLIETL